MKVAAVGRSVQLVIGKGAKAKLRHITAEDAITLGQQLIAAGSQARSAETPPDAAAEDAAFEEIDDADLAG